MRNSYLGLIVLAVLVYIVVNQHRTVTPDLAGRLKGPAVMPSPTTGLETAGAPRNVATRPSSPMPTPAQMASWR